MARHLPGVKFFDSLGTILHELLNGAPPFHAATVVETLRQAQNGEPRRLTQLSHSVPLDLETICLKCLEKRPERRYGTALELADDLRRLQAGEPIAARPISRPERTWRWARRRLEPTSWPAPRGPARCTGGGRRRRCPRRGGALASVTTTDERAIVVQLGESRQLFDVPGSWISACHPQFDLVAVSSFSDIELWSVRQQRKLRILRGHENKVTGLKINAVAEVLTSTS